MRAWSSRLFSALVRAFTGPRGPSLVALVAVVISLPALSFGFMSDDRTIAWQIEHGDGPFRLFQASAERVAAWRETGGIVWWASPRLAISFFRPISSLSHTLDYHLWGALAWPMALENVAFYGLSVFLAAACYRKLLPTRGGATLAALLFAVNDAHAMSVGWISGRNTLLSVLGALCALYAAVRSHEDESRLWVVASTLSVAFALLCGEAGVSAPCLLLAYAWSIRSVGTAAALSRILPQLVVFALWVVGYLAQGYGVHGTSFYRELSTPLATAWEGLLDLPLVFTSLFGPSLVGGALMLPPTLGRALVLPLCAGLLWVVWPTRALLRDTRFFIAATLLCALPSLLTVAQDRVLFTATFGAFGWIAQVVCLAAEDSRRRGRTRKVVLLGIHGVLSPLAYPMNLASVRRFEHGTEALAEAVTSGADVVLVNSPFELLSNYTLSLLDLRTSTKGPPRTLHQLYAGGSELVLERIDERTLTLSTHDGWGYAPIERIFCAASEMPRLGSVVNVAGMEARVEASTPSGMPARVRFTFPDRLESAHRQWLVWQGARPVAFLPPAHAGDQVRVPALSLLSAMPP